MIFGSNQKLLMARAGVIPVDAGDISNASYDNVSYSVGSQEVSPIDVNFNGDGTKMYICGFLSDAVFQYSLSTAYDVSTASYDSVSLSSRQNNPSGLAFNTNGTKLYINSGNTIDQYSLSTAYDVSTASYDSASGSVTSSAYSLRFNSNGTRLFTVNVGSSTIDQYSLSTAFDISTLSSRSATFSVSSQDNSPGGMDFNKNGTKMFVAGYQNDTVYQYSLSTPYTVNTASYDSVSLDISAQTTLPFGLIFNKDVDKMYVIGNNVTSVLQYSTA